MNRFKLAQGNEKPVRLLGLYKKLENTDIPFGKHYNRDAEIALHNEQAYKFCPYARHVYTTERKQLKDELTYFEKNIYNSVRDYFDYAICLLEKATGLKITEKVAEDILCEYLAGEGYMYYGATYYNIPWMLLYFCTAKPVYGKLVREDSPLYEMLKDRSDVLLVKYRDGPYYKVDKTGRWLDLEYSAILHDRKIINGEVKEEMLLCLSSLDKRNLPMQVAEKVLEINEYRFPNWIHSEKATQYRNDNLLKTAKRLMPDLDGDDII